MVAQPPGRSLLSGSTAGGALVEDGMGGAHVPIAAGDLGLVVLRADALRGVAGTAVAATTRAVGSTRLRAAPTVHCSAFLDVRGLEEGVTRRHDRFFEARMRRRGRADTPHCDTGVEASKVHDTYIVCVPRATCMRRRPRTHRALGLCP
jgi:hypothetical protein